MLTLADVAEMLEFDAREASLSAIQVEQVAVLIRLSDDAAFKERTDWERRAQVRGAAAQMLRRLIEGSIRRGDTAGTAV